MSVPSGNSLVSLGKHRDSQKNKTISLGSDIKSFSYPEPFLRAVNGARRGALAKSKPDTIKTWYLVEHCACSTLIEHAQCLTGYHVFMVSGLDFARAPRRAPLTARKKGSGYENDIKCIKLTFCYCQYYTSNCQMRKL